MKKYAFYDNNTMEILQVSQLPEDDLLQYNLPYVEFNINIYNPMDFKYLVVDNLVVELKRDDSGYIKQQEKEYRNNLVSSIEIVYDGMIYQGDEVSQGRMSRVISSMLDTDTIMWKAKDNSKVKLTKIDLTQILRLSIIEQTKVW